MPPGSSPHFLSSHKRSDAERGSSRAAAHAGVPHCDVRQPHAAAHGAGQEIRAVKGRTADPEGYSRAILGTGAP